MAYIDYVTKALNIQPEAAPTRVRLSQYENGRTLYFTLVGNENPIPNNVTVTISGTKPDGTVYSGTGSISNGDTVLIQETLQMTAAAGPWDAKVKLTSGGNTVATGRIRFLIDADTVEPGSVPSDSTLEGLVEQAQQYAETARQEAYGSPLTASTVAGMTDHTRVYVYTGSETGYTFGNWYYWNGTAWTSGGVYNSTAVQTDKNLVLSDVAADGKAVGDELADVKSDLQDAASQVDAIEEMIAGIEPTTTASKAYAVGDLVIVNDILYKVTSAISAGTLLKPSNTTQTTIADALKYESTDIRSRLYESVNDLEGSIDSLSDDVDDLKGELADVKSDLSEISEQGGVEYTYTPLPYVPNSMERTRQGIRFVQNTDGTVQASGANDGTGSSFWGIQDADGVHYFQLSASKTYRLTGCPSGGGADKYDINIRTASSGSLFVDNGDGVVFTPNEDGLYQVCVTVRKNFAISGTLTFTPLLEERTEIYTDLSAIDRFARKGLGLFDNTIVTPQMFGAMGDGITDDSQAVTDANGYNANAVFFPPGVYNLSNVVATKPWIMANNAWITTTTANGTVVTIAGNGNTYKLNCRFRNINPYWAIDVTGNYNHIEQLVVDGMVYDGNTQPYGSAALMIHGNGNTVDFAKFRDFTQSNPNNDSAPQCIATLDNATGNYFADIYSYNCRGTFINASGAGTKNSVGTIKTVNAHDNGIYNVRGGHLDIGVLDHDGDDEGFVVITDTGNTLSSATIGTLICKNCVVAIRIKNAGQVRIGQAFIVDCSLGIRLDLNNSVSESLIIDSFKMFGKILKPIYASDDGLRGVLNNLRIGEMYIKHDSAATGATASDLQTYIDVSAVDQCYIGKCDIDFNADDSAYQNTNPVKMILIDTPTKRSYIGLSKINSNRHDLLITPINHADLQTIKNGLITQNGIKVDKSGIYDSDIFADAVPQSGTWLEGQKIRSTNPAVAEYVYTSSGWKSVTLT